MKVVRTQFTEITAQNKENQKEDGIQERTSGSSLCPYSKNTAQSHMIIYCKVIFYFMENSSQKF